MLLQFLYIFIFLFVGEGVNQFLGVSVPGTVIGMVLLFLALLIGMVKLEQIEKSGNILLSYMVIFFIPPGVGLIKSMHMLEGYWVKIIVIMVVTTILTIGVTGRIIQFVIGRAEDGKVNN